MPRIRSPTDAKTVLSALKVYETVANSALHRRANILIMNPAERVEITTMPDERVMRSIKTIKYFEKLRNAV